MSPRDLADVISGMCAQGKHGRCTGWMVVPSYGDIHDDADISVQCRCRTCKHPPVDPKHHLTHKATQWTEN